MMNIEVKIYIDLNFFHQYHKTENDEKLHTYWLVFVDWRSMHTSRVEKEPSLLSSFERCKLQ